MNTETEVKGTTEDFFLYELALLEKSIVSKLREMRDVAHKNSVGQLQLYESLRSRIRMLEEENDDLKLLFAKEKLNG